MLPLLSDSFICLAAHDRSLSSPTPSPPSDILRCLLTAATPTLSAWGPPVTGALLALPQHPAVPDSAAGIVLDTADAAPAAAAVLRCLAAGLTGGPTPLAIPLITGGRTTAGGALRCAAAAAAPALDKRVPTAVSAVELLLPPNSIKTIRLMADAALASTKHTERALNTEGGNVDRSPPAAYTGQTLSTKLAESISVPKEKFGSISVPPPTPLTLAGSISVPEEKFDSISVQPPTFQGLLLALNSALAHRGPALGAQKIIDSLELRGAIYK